MPQVFNAFGEEKASFGEDNGQCRRMRSSAMALSPDSALLATASHVLSWEEDKGGGLKRGKEEIGGLKRGKEEI
jgi:hypothetical protein